MAFHEKEVVMIISFAGHALVPYEEKVKEIVKEQLRDNISVDERILCYLGGYGAFDKICASVCRELKMENPKIELIYITPYLNFSEQAKIKEAQEMGTYDRSIYPPIENVPPKYAISKRNEWMMSNSDLIIVYVKHTFGGAYKSLQVAKRRKKRIINICDLI